MYKNTVTVEIEGNTIEDVKRFAGNVYSALVESPNRDGITYCVMRESIEEEGEYVDSDEYCMDEEDDFYD